VDTTSDTTPATRRQVLAFLALADAPAPSEVRFGSDPRWGHTVSLEVGSFANASAWRTAFGDDRRWWGGGEPSLIQTATGPLLMDTWYTDGWRGWQIRLNAQEPGPAAGAGLDADTREQLAAIAAGGTP
jgi:hypothetical protein